MADAEGVRAHPEALAADPAPDVAEVLDLGAGGGVPGLVIAAAWPEVHWTLLDVQQRRVRFLAETVEGLGLGRRVEVVGERAELFGRRESSRAHFAVVVARGFGSPSATAEMAAPLVRVGGAVLVSEPPGAAGERWPSGPLRKLGLVVPADPSGRAGGRRVASGGTVPVVGAPPRRASCEATTVLTDGRA